MGYEMLMKAARGRAADAGELGCIVGALIFLLSKGRNSHILRFDEQLFFIYVLPPIIFNAGFQVKKKQFFHNFLTIMSFGVFGVFISVAIVSAGFYWLLPKVGFGKLDAVDYLALGVIFSSTDTVCTLQVISQDETPRLYSLVFGEGVVNDATSVVLFNAIKNMDITKIKSGAVLKVIGDFLYLFATSTILGATLLSLSGILTVFFCGIVMSHYAWHNVTESSRITTRHIFATLSFIAETFIFLYVGMDALDMDKWKTTQASFKTSIGIFGVIISLILLGRAAFVFPLSILSNFMSGNSEKAPITFKHQVVIWWAGLMRGAVSIALAYNQADDKRHAPAASAPGAGGRPQHGKQLAEGRVHPAVPRRRRRVGEWKRLRPSQEKHINDVGETHPHGAHLLEEVRRQYYKFWKYKRKQTRRNSSGVQCPRTLSDKRLLYSRDSRERLRAGGGGVGASGCALCLCICSGALPPPPLHQCWRPHLYGLIFFISELSKL
uniref:Sodium/hydrogen exchanger 4 n=1 Tax=Aegilops tauschii TaxID=37682 RepID=M8AXN2_AEGTA